jgi:hypothetical protein
MIVRISEGERYPEYSVRSPKSDEGIIVDVPDGVIARFKAAEDAYAKAEAELETYYEPAFKASWGNKPSASDPRSFIWSFSGSDAK